MAIPVHLQQFKAAGVYRVVFDKSTMLNNEPETLRLVVGYSEVGPFNCPVYVKDPQEFVQYFGNISKKLEKRGIYFHRMCLQMLAVSPIICLNLKKFSGETVGASTINTSFNVNYDPIDDVKINVEDIFDKTRFWEISAEQLNDLNSVDGITLNNYINLSVTDTYNSSVSYFIRKPSGSKISEFNLTVSDWYSDKYDEMPEYLHGLEHRLISDFFAEIYVFKGRFKAAQVLASDSLKKYFVATDKLEDDEPNSRNYKLKLRTDLHNSYGELIDTLDALYADPTSNAIGHWIGCLIPYFKDKKGNYRALDIMFNNDNNEHKMMMSFNTDLLEEDGGSIIDMSGKGVIPESQNLENGALINGASSSSFNNPLSLETIFQGVAKTNLLGNITAPVVADKIEFSTSITNFKDLKIPDLNSQAESITGSLYVADVIEVSYPEYQSVKIEANTNPEEGEDKDSYVYVNPWTKDRVVISKEDYKNYTDGIVYIDMKNGQASATKPYEGENAPIITPGTYNVILRQVGSDTETVTIICEKDRLDYVLKTCGVTNYSINTDKLVADEPAADAADGAEPHYSDWHILWHDTKTNIYKFNSEWKNNYKEQGLIGGTFWRNDIDSDENKEYSFAPYEENDYNMGYYGPTRIITTIRRLENREKGNDETKYKYTDIDTNFVCGFKSVNLTAISSTPIGENKESVYGSSVSFINSADWAYTEDLNINGGIYNALVSLKEYNTTLQLILKTGDCILAEDAAVDKNDDHIIDDNDEDLYCDCVYVTGEGTLYDDNGNFKCHYITLSGAPYGYDICKYTNEELFNGSIEKTVNSIKGGWTYDATADGEQNTDEYTWNDDDLVYDKPSETFIIRLNAALNQEIGEMVPHYLEGYTYKNARPNGTDMWAKLQWQRQILSALSDYSGLRKGLLNKANIDYRYVVDTFESFPQSELKSELTLLCKEKESAFCIANLPSIRTFVKCPYTSFTDDKNVFNSKYVVEGRNRKKPANEVFSLPSENNGASFVGFYTPLKFSDGYVDTIVPSAGLVSNLFIQKYMSRQPYYIVAGPNYGRISATGLVGPDYKFSREELYDLEPFGFNCMIYRPSFGTFINANQTAKQTPLSALSRINVRELVIYLQDEIEKVLQSYQWEFNNQTTRNAILDKANQVCALIKANGGIQTYLNIMDESNNTPEIIDNEMAVLSTHIEPGFGCGKMVHELTLYRTGQMSSLITEG